MIIYSERTGASSKTTTSQPRRIIMIALKSFSTAKSAFVVSLQMAGEKRRHVRSRNVMRSITCVVQNKGIILNDQLPANC